MKSAEQKSIGIGIAIGAGIGTAIGQDLRKRTKSWRLLIKRYSNRYKMSK